MNKKVLSITAFLCFLILVAVLAFKERKHFLPSLTNSKSEPLITKTITDSPVPVTDGVSFDPEIASQENLWVTGVVDEVQVIEQILPKTENSFNQDVNFGLVEIKMTVPVQDSDKKIIALTVLADDVALTTDGLSYSGLPSTELATKVRPGDKIRLNVVNMSPDKYKIHYSQAHGILSGQGEMMTYLVKSFQGDTQSLASKNIGTDLTGQNTTVIFDGLLINPSKN